MLSYTAVSGYILFMSRIKWSNDHFMFLLERRGQPCTPQGRLCCISLNVFTVPIYASVFSLLVLLCVMNFNLNNNWWWLKLSSDDFITLQQSGESKWVGNQTKLVFEETKHEAVDS